MLHIAKIFRKYKHLKWKPSSRQEEPEFLEKYAETFEKILIHL